MSQEKCNEKTEVYSRVVGFFRPVQQWNKGKKEEFAERKEYVPNVGGVKGNQDAGTGISGNQSA